jgi:hypothetical protein
MNYTVVWRRRAEVQLAALWLRATNKEANAGYAEQIDRILAPADQGESRTGNVRLWFHRPLSALFQIDEPARRVIVLAIKWVGR